MYPNIFPKNIVPHSYIRLRNFGTNQHIEMKLQAIEMKYLIRTKRVSQKDGMKNIKIRTRLEVNSVHHKIERQQL